MASSAHRKRGRSLSAGRSAPISEEDPPSMEAASTAAAILCVGCAVDLSEHVYAEIIGGKGEAAPGCSHILCMECFGMAHAERSAYVKLRCQASGCQYNSVTWNIHAFAGRTRRRRINEQSITRPASYGDRTYHPNLYYQHQPPAYRNKYSLLSLVSQNEGDQRLTNCYVAELRHDENVDEISDDSRQALGAIGRSLHSCFMKRKDEQTTQSHSAYAGGQSIPELERQDTSILRTFIHGISTGEEFKTAGDGEERSASMAQRMYNMSYAAADVVRTAKGGGFRGSRLKDFLSDHLNIAGVSDRVKDLFSSIGLSRSRNYMNLAQDRAVDAIIEQGWPPEGRGYGIVAKSYDNMGMRKRMGYVQYVLMLILFASVQDLIAMRIYPDPKNKNYEEAKEACLSRYSLSWGSAKHAEPGEEGYYEFSISKEDARLMASEVTLPTIEFVLQSMKDGTFPTLEEAIEKVQNDSFPPDPKQTISRGASGRVAKRGEGGEDITMAMGRIDVADEGVNDIDELDEDLLETDKTIYDVNNAVSDLPWKMDLNNTDTVKKIYSTIDDLRKECLDRTVLRPIPDDDADVQMAEGDDPDNISFNGNPWAENDWPVEHWPEPWMRSEGAYMLGDGHPTFAALKFRREDRAFREMEVMPFNGIFHTMLEMHKLRGKMFGPSHLREIWQHWRKTKAQLDWVMSPGDPKQCEDEMAGSYMGIIVGAVDALLSKRQQDGSDLAGVSAIDVYEFMKETARECPIVQVLYNELRFAETVFLLQQAEEEGNAKKFVTAMKFCSILFTTSNATKYSDIAAEFLIWWHCASEAEKVLFERFIFVRKTKEGKNIGTDRFQEWSVKDMRGWTGKFFRRGTDPKMERGAALMGLRKEFLAAFDPKRPADKTTRNVGKAFCFSLKFMHDHEVWKRRELNRLKLQSDSPIASVEMIDLPVVGVDRMDQHITIKFKNDGMVERDGEQVLASPTQLLKQIQPTVDKQRELDDINLERTVSTTISYVVPNYTAKELKVVYKDLKKYWDETYYNPQADDNPFPRVEGSKKYYYAKAICEARKQLIKADPEWERVTKERIQEEIDQRNEAARNQIRDRLQSVGCSPFVHLCIEGSDLRERYSERHVLEGGSGGIEQQQQQQAESEGRRSYINVFKRRASK